MKRIAVLDELTINKIAAGEVVERPSSVIKELVENAIDANATRITVEVSEGGKNFIKIIDNGDGIHEEDIHLAFERHSTSKIQRIEDIDTLYSNGFRGEALSSISSVSKIELTTNTDDSKVGKQAQVYDGKVQAIQNTGAKKGTTITVFDLFYNVPARKKFLKSTATETANISDIMMRLAIANPEVAIKYISNKKEVFSTTGDGEMASAIAVVYGRSFSSRLVPIEFKNDIVRLKGYVSNTSLYQSNRKKENIFINKRYVRTTPLTYVIENLYKGIIPLGKFPAFFLSVDIRPNLVDPNVHPAKLEVKISSDLDIAGPLADTIKQALFRSSGNLIPKARAKSFYSYDESGAGQRHQEDSISRAVAEDSKPWDKNLFEYEEVDVENSEEKNRQITVEHVEHKDIEASEPGLESVFPKAGFFLDKSMDSGFKTLEEKTTSFDFDKTANEEKDATFQQASVFETENEVINYNDFSYIGIALNTYIIVTYKDALLLVDQHAGHERVMFEKIKKELSFGNPDKTLEAQALLLADIREFSAIEHDLIMQNKAVFHLFGFEIDDFGFNRIAIRTYPILFGKVQDQGLFDEIANFIQLEKNIDLNQTFLDKIATMACKKAVKANQALSKDEVRLLFAQMEQCENKYTCPHGRPIFVELRKYEIEKMFKRVL